VVIASPWRRLVASLVDSLVLLPLSLLLMALAGVDPILDERNRTAEMLVGLALSLLGKRIF